MVNRIRWSDLDGQFEVLETAQDHGWQVWYARAGTITLRRPNNKKTVIAWDMQMAKWQVIHLS